MVQPAVFLHRQVIEELSLLSEKLSCSMDTAYFLQIWHHFSPIQIQYLPKVLAYERKWEGAKTVKDVWASELLQVFQEFFEEYSDEYRDQPDVRKQAYAEVFRRQATQQAQAGQRLEAQLSAMRVALLYPQHFEGLRRLALLTLTNWLGKPMTAKIRQTWQEIRASF
jgi:hypothetical protein